MLRLVVFAVLALATPTGRPATIHVAAGPEPQYVASDDALYAVSTRPDRVGRIVAPVHINGQGPFHFMLDTGANRTVLSERAARRLGLTIGVDTISVRGVNGRAQARTTMVERLDAGALRFENTLLPVLTGPVLDRVDGILGMDGFSGMKITADFVRDRITIVESRGRRAPLNRIVLRCDLISGHLLLIDGRVGRVPVKAVIDTGGMQTLGNLALQRALAAERGPARRGHSAGVVDATEVLQMGEASASPTIWLGQASIRYTTVTYGDFEIFRVWGLEEEPALLIGMDVLGTLAEIAIDYRRRELQLRPRGS